MGKESGRSEGGRLGARCLAAVIASYAACLAVVASPTLAAMRTALPDRVDALQHLWVMRWYRTCLLEWRSPLICPDIQYPVGAPLGNFSPLHLQAMLFLPISMVTGDDVLSYNVLWLLAHLVAGLGTFALAWGVLRDREGAWFAGLVAMMATPMVAHRAHLELLYAGTFPIFLLGWIRFIDRPSRGRLAAAAGSYVLVAMSAAYYAAFATVPAAMYLLSGAAKAARGGRDSWRDWARPRAIPLIGFGAIAGGSLGVLFAPVAWSKSGGFAAERSGAEFARYGTAIWSYLVPLPDHGMGRFVPSGWYARSGLSGEGFSYLGAVPLLLIVVAAVRRSRFAHARFLWATFGVLVVLSMGASLTIGPWTIPLPASGLRAALPMFRPIRVPARFNLFAAVVASVLAGAGLVALRGMVRRPACLTIVAAASALTIYDLGIPPHPVPIPESPGAYAWLKAHAPGSAIVEIPQFSSGGAHVVSAAPAYWQALHGGKTTAGYSGMGNARLDDLLGWKSPFAAGRLASPGYLRNAEGEYLDMAFSVDFEAFAWLYLKANRLDYVVLHRWPGAVTEEPVDLGPLQARLAKAAVYEDPGSVVYSAERLAPPRRPLAISTTGWRGGAAFRGLTAQAAGTEAKVVAFNPDARRPVRLRLDANALHRARDVRILGPDGRELARWRVGAGLPQFTASPPFVLPRGLCELTLACDDVSRPRSSEERIPPEDARPYSLRVVGLDLRPADEPAWRAGPIAIRIPETTAR